MTSPSSFALPYMRRKTRVLVALVSLGIWSVSCSGGGRRDKDDDRGPPSLRFEGATNTDSQSFDSEADQIELGCDPRLTFRLGPSETQSGLLDNWLMRPRNNCKSREQCGYIELEFFTADDESLARFTAATLAFVVDTSEFPAVAVNEVQARLIQGNSGEPFVVTEVSGVKSQVTATWPVVLIPPESCPTMGGAPGTGGEDGGTGGAPAAGGNSTTGGSPNLAGAASLGGIGGAL